MITETYWLHHDQAAEAGSPSETFASLNDAKSKARKLLSRGHTGIHVDIISDGAVVDVLVLDSDGQFYTMS